MFEGLAAVRDLPIRVVHAGVLQPEWGAALERLGIVDRFQVLGLLPREKIAPLQLGAACLLLIGNRGGLQLPGKLLDYLGARRPIYALKNDAHDIAAHLVSSRRAGHLVPNEPVAIARGLRELYASWKGGSLDERFQHPGAPEFPWSRLEGVLDRALRSHLAMRSTVRGSNVSIRLALAQPEVLAQHLLLGPGIKVRVEPVAVVHQQLLHHRRLEHHPGGIAEHHRVVGDRPAHHRPRR